MRCPHFKGEWKTSNRSGDGEDIKMYEIIAIAKRLHFSFDELKEISFTTLINMIMNNVESDSREATQNDIDSF